MPLQPFSQRVTTDLALIQPDQKWIDHRMPNDPIQVPPDQVPDQDTEFNLLVQENERWQESRPSGNLSKKSASPIVVVNAGGQTLGDPANDEDLKKLREIPRFQPLLKGVLPGQRDSPSVYSKIEAKFISRFIHRMQEHFTLCYESISTNQTSIYAKIAEVDHKSTNLFRNVTLNGKKYESLANDLKRAKSIHSQLESIQSNLDEIISGLSYINELLPKDHRLPILPSMPATEVNAEDFECRVTDFKR